ncbi:MAG TPA: ATP-dependent Clp protease adaptor ClpS [Fimbriimonadales bacterium]|nr:ATP-dependent Clp protease adaptor ClpS [Fimbriimonadales bacterium]
MTNTADVSIIPSKEIEEKERIGGGRGGGWMVTVYDNNYNTWEEVMHILQVATGCTAEEAYIETWEIHNLGKSIVHRAAKEECEKASAIISTIGIRVEVSREE